MFSKIIVNSSWYFVLLSFSIGLLGAIFLYFKSKKNSDVPKKILYFLFTLRFFSVTTISFFLLSIFFKHLNNETQNPIIIIAIDNSSSIIANKDSADIKQNFFSQINRFKETLSKNFDLKVLLFGNSVKSLDQNILFNEKETDISNLISEIENNYSNQNIGALVLVSDGIYNKGSNPLYTSEKLSYPIYPIALGDTSEIKDVSIQKINHNQIAYLGNNFPVEVIVKGNNIINKEITVSLIQNQTIKAKQVLKITSNNFIATCNFTCNASSKGISKYTVKIPPISDEKNSLNNEQSFVVDVIDNKEKFLLLADVPHPDIAAIKEAITSSTNYEIDYSLSNNFKKSLKEYNLIILHGSLANQNSIINECKLNLIPFWIINPSTSENLTSVKITSNINKFNEAESYFNTSFGLFSLSDDFKKFCNELPVITTFFGNYTLGNGSNSLINQRIGNIETENPILVFSDINGLKTGLFIGDGLWKWGMRDFAEHKNRNLFNELISKSVQYLSVKNDKSFFRLTAPKIINENEVVEFSAEVYNKSYELITEPDVAVTLTDDKGKKYNYTFSKTSNMYKLNLGLLPFGEYQYEAKTKLNGEVFIKKGSLVVKEIIAEKMNTLANHQLLNAMANRSGGKLFYRDQLNQLQNELLKNEQIKPITYSQNNTSLLIDLKWLFWLILSFLCVEWFFRKRYLSI